MLNISQAKAAYTPDKDLMLADGRSGLYLRVRKSGLKTWVLRAQHEKKTFKKNIGEFPTMSISEARVVVARLKENLRLYGNLDHGLEHPTESVDSDEQAEQETIADLSKDYKKSLGTLKSSTHKKYEYLIDRFIVPEIGDHTPIEVNRKVAVNMIENHKGSPGTAGEISKVACNFFNWLLERHIIEYNPFARMSAAVREIRPTPRERVLEESEIKKVWKILTDPSESSSSVHSRKALLFILVTAQRPGEVSGACADEIKGDWWTVPPERTKNNKESKVYLTSLAKSITSQLRPTGPVFLSYQNPLDPTPILRNSLSQFIRRHPVLREMSFTPHDLRRTAATGLSRLGCSDEIIDAILNHTKKGTIAIYNRHKYDAEKQEWLQKWSNELERLCL